MIRTLSARLSGLPGLPPARLARLAFPLLLVGCWSIVTLWHLRMPYPSDQLHYMVAGAAFPNPPDNTQLAHQVLRFGVTAPTRVAIAVFGYSQAAYYVVPMLASLMLLFGTYALGALLFTRSVGAVGAAVVITSSPVFYDVTDLLPDLLAAGLFTVAVAVAVAVRQERISARPAVLLGIGALLGWSYLAREFIVFVWPLVPLLLWRPLRAGGGPSWWRGMLWLAAPIAALVAAETLLCWATFGDPLARLHAAAGHGEAPSPPKIAATYRDKPRVVYLRRLWATLGGYPPGPHYPEGWWLRGLLLATVAGGLLRPRRFWPLLTWCALLWVPLTLLGGIVDPAAPKLRLQLVRYWFPIFPAFVLGGLGLLWLAGCGLRAWYEARAERPAVPGGTAAPVPAQAAGPGPEPGAEPGSGEDPAPAEAQPRAEAGNEPRKAAPARAAEVKETDRVRAQVAEPEQVIEAAPAADGVQPVETVRAIDAVRAVEAARAARGARTGVPATSAGPDGRRRAPGPLGILAAALPLAAVLAVGGVTVGSAARGWWYDPGTRAGGATQMEDLRAWMGREGRAVRTVWAENRTRAILEIYQRGPYGGRVWDARLLPLEPVGRGPAPAAGDLVVVFDAGVDAAGGQSAGEPADPDSAGEICGVCRSGALSALGDPPVPRSGWHEVFTSGDGVLRVYAVGHN